MISIIDPSTDKVLSVQENRMIIIEGGSWQDYWSISHEDIKVEFIGDEIFIQSPASLSHEEIFVHMLTLLKNSIQKETGKILGSRFPIKLVDGKRVEPDIMFLSKNDLSSGSLTPSIFEGSPSFIIEIVSPNYRKHDTERKLKAYKDLGVGEYIIIDPELREIRQVIFEHRKIVKNNLHTDDSFNPITYELSHVEINPKEIWSLLE